MQRAIVSCFLFFLFLTALTRKRPGKSVNSPIVHGNQARSMVIVASRNVSIFAFLFY